VKKEIYVEAEICVVLLEYPDIITTSGQPTVDPDDTDWGGGQSGRW